ncbi:MAG: hypothetical protein ABFC98_06830 [Candidatus Cloacimonas sp.]
MNEIIINKNAKNQFDTLPKGWVFFLLSSEKEELYAGYSANLKAKIDFFSNKAKEGGIHQEMWNAAKTLQWISYPEAISALIHYKCHLAKNLPLYQYQIRPWAEYVYLALDSHRYPFITIQDNTNEDWLYLGPFRSRFFLIDVLDIFARMLKLPACETGEFPCEKKEINLCQGWCMALEGNTEKNTEYNLDKLESLFKEIFLVPENGILELIQQERNNYFNELEFEKASLLDEEIDLLNKYRKWLQFLIAAKHLEYDSEELKIQQGKITFCRMEGKSYNFPVDNTEFRINETLALNLDSVDESKIIYDFLRKDKGA